MVKIKSCYARWNARIKNLDYMDLKHIKLSSIAFILFLITVWPGLMALVHKIHWGWFLAAFVLFGIRPSIRFWK